MSLIICRPAEFLRRRIASCPICRSKRRFVGREAVWYGITWSCCGCGDSWTDGELHPRPFCRGWRAEAIARAKRMWDEAGPFDQAVYDRWCREQLGEVTE